MLKHLHTFPGHQNPVYALANSAKPGIFFSAGNDKGVVEWSLDKMAFVKVLVPVQSSVYALHSLNHLLFIGERSGAINVFDFTAQKVTARFPAHQKAVFDIKTIRNKNELITASEDGTVAIWSLTDFNEIYRFNVSANTVRTIAISNDEQEIAFGSKDGLIRIYDVNDYGIKHRLESHTHPVLSLAYHPNGKSLLSGGRDAQLKIWTLPDYRLQESITAHMFGIYAIAFHPDLPYFATCSQDKSIKIWGTNDYKLYKILSLEKAGAGHTHSINKLIWSTDGKYLISTGDDKQVIIWDWE